MKSCINVFGMILIIFLFSSCEDKPVIPSLTTTIATEISTTTAISGGNIIDDGGAIIISGGVCWNTSDDPTIENNRTIEGGQLSSFTSNITQLSPNTTYYLRAYATNSAGTGYGKSVTFKTLGDKPSSSNINTSNITINSATFNGSVNANLLSTTVTFEYGVTTSYGNTATVPQNPVTGNSNVNVTSDLTGLTPGTTYHFKIKTENSLGITYSNDMTFTTLGKVPDATILAASNIQLKTATVSGSVNPNLLSSTVIFEWGTTTSFGNSITLAQSPVTGSTAVDVSTILTGLTPGTTYLFRIKTENSLGITYSNNMTFTTLGKIPDVTVLAATNLQLRTATISGSVNPNLLSTAVTFEWGTTTNYENSVTPAQSPVIGSAATDVSTTLTGLTPGTTYHFRIKAVNEIGTVNSNDLTFITLGQIPSTTSQTVTDLKVTQARINGLVNPHFLPTTVVFEWGTTTSYGNTLAFAQNPVDGNTSVNVFTDISGLEPETTYHFRVKATNELGTSNSEDLTFTTYALMDIDNNYYHSVNIGSQTWMAENLRTKHYSNGDPIYNGESAENYCDQKSYYFNYNLDPSNTSIYGLLYNYYAASNSHTIEPIRSSSIPSGIQGACPTGWHMPSYPEFQLLIDFLGGPTVAGGKLKSLQLWDTPNLGGSNSSGFNLLPAGAYDKLNYGYSYLGKRAFLWSTTEGPDYLFGPTIEYNSAQIIFSVQHRCNGASIRCVKD